MRPTGLTLIAVYDYLAGAFLGTSGLRPVRWRQSHQVCWAVPTWFYSRARDSSLE